MLENVDKHPGFGLADGAALTDAHLVAFGGAGVLIMGVELIAQADDLLEAGVGHAALDTHDDRLGGLGGGDHADGFAAHAAAIVALQRDLLADAVGDASPAAWARRWRRWARDSTREVLAHNAFIATGAREAPDFMDDAAFDAYVDRAFEVQGVVI